jgi:hypothetical protein
MLDLLDTDGSGDISLAEFEDFYHQAPPLRWNDGMHVCVFHEGFGKMIEGVSEMSGLENGEERG